MAIKIDLLPAYVKLRRDLHRSIAASIVVSGLVLGGLLMVLHQRQLELQTAEINLVNATAVANLKTKADEGLAAATTSSGPILSAINFMAAASKTGPQRAALLDQVRKAIYSDAIVSSIDISDGQKVSIKAVVRDSDEYATFLLNLRRASDVQGGTLFKGRPVASGPGGFANGASPPFVPPFADGSEPAVAYVYPLNVTAEGVLLNPIQLPVDPVGGATGTPGAPGGAAPGVPPGVPQGVGGPPAGFNVPPPGAPGSPAP